MVLGDVQPADDGIHGIPDESAVNVGNGSKAHHADTEWADLESKICGKILDGAECCAAVAPGTCARAGLPVTKIMTPERRLIMWRAAAEGTRHSRAGQEGEVGDARFLFSKQLIVGRIDDALHRFQSCLKIDHSGFSSG